jgi:hypothetical protein
MGRRNECSTAQVFFTAADVCERSWRYGAKISTGQAAALGNYWARLGTEFRNRASASLMKDAPDFTGIPVIRGKTARTVHECLLLGLSARMPMTAGNKFFNQN